MASRKIEDLEPALQKAFQSLRDIYRTKFKNRDVILTCTYRSPEEQQEIYAIGRTKPGKKKTFCDGVKLLSKHNYRPARAFDVAVTELGAAVWMESYYEPFRAIARDLGLLWGGTWAGLKDYPHFEAMPCPEVKTRP